jgi:hypothetical protein
MENAWCHLLIQNNSQIATHQHDIRKKLLLLCRARSFLSFQCNTYFCDVDASTCTPSSSATICTTSTEHKHVIHSLFSIFYTIHKCFVLSRVVKLECLDRLMNNLEISLGSFEPNCCTAAPPLLIKSCSSSLSFGQSLKLALINERYLISSRSSLLVQEE